MGQVERWLDGKRVVIIAGGESVTLKQIRQIAIARLEMAGSIRVIAVNDAVYPAWWADWLHSCDGKWWRWHIQRVAKFPGIKTTLDHTLPDEWGLVKLNNTGKDGFDPDPGNCRTLANSAGSAMHCAIHAGAVEIGLVGVDMDDRQHWFGVHEKNAVDVDRETVMLPSFASLDPELKARGIRVWNASPVSRLELWPKIDLETALMT